MNRNRQNRRTNTRPARPAGQPGGFYNYDDSGSPFAGDASGYTGSCSTPDTSSTTTSTSTSSDSGGGCDTSAS